MEFQDAILNVRSNFHYNRTWCQTTIEFKFKLKIYFQFKLTQVKTLTSETTYHEVAIVILRTVLLRYITRIPYRSISLEFLASLVSTPRSLCLVEVCKLQKLLVEFDDDIKSPTTVSPSVEKIVDKFILCEGLSQHHSLRDNFDDSFHRFYIDSNEWASPEDRERYRCGTDCVATMNHANSI